VTFVILTAGATAVDPGGVTAWVMRNPLQIRNLSRRTLVWRHLVDVTLREGPILGLGYVAATRERAPEAWPQMANAHSCFFEVFTGGGGIALAVYLIIWVVSIVGCVRLLLAGKPGASLLSLLLFALLAFAAENVHALPPSPTAFVFLAVVGTVTPRLRLVQRASTELGREAG